MRHGACVMFLWYLGHMTLLLCTQCQEPVLSPRKTQRDAFNRRGRIYCSDACGKAAHAQASSERALARWESGELREIIEARMNSDRNPMRSEGCVEKMKSTRAAAGNHRPQIRGGNGAPMAEPQRRLADFLGWKTEFPVGIRDGLTPVKYSLDIAHPALKICVEVDGRSHHGGRRVQDAKRDARLASLGWHTFRFSNQEAMELTADCAREVWSTTLKLRGLTPTEWDLDL